MVNRQQSEAITSNDNLYFCFSRTEKELQFTVHRNILSNHLSPVITPHLLQRLFLSQFTLNLTKILAIINSPRDSLFFLPRPCISNLFVSPIPGEVFPLQFTLPSHATSTSLPKMDYQDLRKSSHSELPKTKFSCMEIDCLIRFLLLLPYPVTRKGIETPMDLA